MVTVIFRSRLTADAGDEYTQTAARMLALAKTMPGFVSFKSFSAADGERLSLIEFESHEAVAAWGAHPEHVQAQRRGREMFYQSFHLDVCDVRRSSDFSR